MKIPDASHPITIDHVSGVVRVIFEGHEIADSDDVLVLREADYPPVYYFSRDSVQMPFLRRTDKVTHCPYKGDAAYFTIYRDRQIIENAAWSYEDPYAAVGPIAGRVAFYPEHVEFQLDDRSPAETEAMDVDEVVRHTDSGSGNSQAQRWPPNVDMPDTDKAEPELDPPYKGVGAI
ncbi:DUF427 domain-containing protein [Caulobacter sp. CCH9-E1]|jgi:uncharacterized protein (DUF427 family)|uniref:DUF427 domain-containing protein n=1 Tax=Caulobacter sp. CCH9-E1 TaxID=1768768 RepID=UPI00082C77A2|nr:DUF427 domain-containing protein [Caulobacter sp. CCH9-E1]